MRRRLARRDFIRTAAGGSVAFAWLGARQAPLAFGSEVAKPAVLGGAPAHQGGWTGWPQWRESWEPQVLKVFRSGRMTYMTVIPVVVFESGRQSFQAPGEVNPQEDPSDGLFLNREKKKDSANLKALTTG